MRKGLITFMDRPRCKIDKECLCSKMRGVVSSTLQLPPHVKLHVYSACGNSCSSGQSCSRHNWRYSRRSQLDSFMAITSHTDSYSPNFFQTLDCQPNKQERRRVCLSFISNIGLLCDFSQALSTLTQIFWKMVLPQSYCKGDCRLSHFVLYISIFNESQ